MPPPVPDYSFETAALADGHRIIAGVDEVGRGPLAGPVVAAAVILNPDDIPPGLSDSKALTPRRREVLARELNARARVAVAMASVEEIEDLNILRASHLAMCRALTGLAVPVDLALIDGTMLPRDLTCRGVPVVRGDARCQSIAAASIVAKCARDRMMVDLAQHHPGYGWETNMGYATLMHRRALRTLGVTAHHRRTFAPVHNILYQGEC